MPYGISEPKYLQSTGQMNYEPYNEALRKQYEADLFKAKLAYAPILQQAAIQKQNMAAL